MRRIRRFTSDRWLRGVLALVALAVPVPALAQSVPLLVDPDLTVAAGATVANAAATAVERLEGRYVPVRLFEERGVPRRAANMAYRTFRLLLFDRPQERWVMVASHEVFGHGGRARELFNGSLTYHIDPPPPYGRGGGVTIAGLDRDYTMHELQAISLAGMEVNSVAAHQIADEAFGQRRLSPRTAVRYLLFELDAFDYIQNTGDAPERPGHDVSDFLQLYEEMAEAVGAPRLTARTLRRQSFASLANPMIASAAISIGRFIATGREDSPVLALPLGTLRVMPALRYRLAPFGTEWAITSDIAWARGTAQIGARVGRAPGARPWGVSASYRGLPVRNWQIDVGLDAWRQPPIAVGPHPELGSALVGRPLAWGGRIRARAESPLVSTWWSSQPAALIVDAALKSPGFIAGEPLREGLVLRAGIGIPLPNP